MTDDEVAKAVREQRGNPKDPICIGCGKRPGELDCYLFMGPFGGAAPYGSVTDCVINEEGTYNPENGHFLCDPCYIKWGQPSSPTGWKAP